MKNFIFLFSFFCFAAMGVQFTACSSNSPKIVKQTDTTAKEYTSAYVCPMHCVGSGSDKAGTCPACKMDYIANEIKADPHEGHDHSDHSGHNH